MSYEVSKDFRFESAHRLGKGYVGKCSNIHGHSWNGYITISVHQLDKQDFSIDFARLGDMTKVIEKQFDHKLLLHEGDRELIEMCSEQDWEVVEFKNNPTCETIAREIFDKVKKWFEQDCRIRVVSVTIKETCTTSCTYYGDK